MRIVKQAAPVTRTVEIDKEEGVWQPYSGDPAGIKEGVWQPYFGAPCDFCKKLSGATKSFCLAMAGCDATQLMV